MTYFIKHDNETAEETREGLMAAQVLAQIMSEKDKDIVFRVVDTDGVENGAYMNGTYLFV